MVEDTKNRDALKWFTQNNKERKVIESAALRKNIRVGLSKISVLHIILCSTLSLD